MMNSIVEAINQGESKTLEFKESLPKNDSIAKTAIAFSNTSGGKLIIGVNNAREIVGIDDSEIFELQDKIASIIFDNCIPNILPEIYTLNVDGKVSDSIGYVSDSIGYRNEQEEKVLNFIKINSLITSKQAEELLQVKESRARKLLKQMCENNLLVKLGSARSTHYKALRDE